MPIAKKKVKKNTLAKKVVKKSVKKTAKKTAKKKAIDAPVTTMSKSSAAKGEGTASEAERVHDAEMQAAKLMENSVDKLYLNDEELIDRVNTLEVSDNGLRKEKAFRYHQIKTRGLSQEFLAKHNVEHLKDFIDQYLPNTSKSQFYDYADTFMALTLLNINDDTFEKISFRRALEARSLIKKGLINDDNIIPQWMPWLDEGSDHSVEKLRHELRRENVEKEDDSNTDEEVHKFRGFKIPGPAGQVVKDCLSAIKRTYVGVGSDGECYVNMAGAWMSSFDAVSSGAAQAIGLNRLLEGLRNTFGIDIMVLSLKDPDLVSETLPQLTLAKVPTAGGKVAALGTSKKQLAQFYGCAQKEVEIVPIDTSALQGAYVGNLELFKESKAAEEPKVEEKDSVAVSRENFHPYQLIHHLNVAQRIQYIKNQVPADAEFMKNVLSNVLIVDDLEQLEDKDDPRWRKLMDYIDAEYNTDMKYQAFLTKECQRLADGSPAPSKKKTRKKAAKKKTRRRS